MVQTFLCENAACCHEWQTTDAESTCAWCGASGIVLGSEPAPDYEALAKRATEAIEDAS